jgi:hypothetical protein
MEKSGVCRLWRSYGLPIKCQSEKVTIGFGNLKYFTLKASDERGRVSDDSASFNYFRGRGVTVIMVPELE